MYTKILIFALTFTLGMSNEWINISSSTPESPNIDILFSDVETTDMSFRLSGFYLNPILIDNEEYFSVYMPKSASLLEQGAPNLPKFSTSIIIPNNKQVVYQILDSEYVEYNDINIAPSKGNISREIDPASIPYYFGDIYENNSYYPKNIISLGNPYILRDFRGVAVQFNPIQYNPVEKVLRVYTHLNVNIYNNGIETLLKTYCKLLIHFSDIWVNRTRQSPLLDGTKNRFCTA